METKALPGDLDERLEDLVQVWWADPDIAAAYLYGSRGREDARPWSDVDIAVVLRAGLSGEERWRKRLALLDAATSGLATEAVDIVVLEEAPSVLGHRVIRDGRLLLDRVPPRRVEVVEDVFRRYLDEAPLRRSLDDGLRDRLRGADLPVDPIVLRRRLRALERYLRNLRDLRRRGRDVFAGDEVVQERVARNAELLAQVCADVALHILAASGAAAPESYGDAIRRIGPFVGFPEDATARVAAGIRLRNLLVHMYLDIDYGRLFDELAWIDDAEGFAVAVETWLSGVEAAGARSQ